MQLRETIGRSRNITRPSLAEREGRGVLHGGAADLDDVLPLLRLAGAGVVQDLDGGNQPCWAFTAAVMLMAEVKVSSDHWGIRSTGRAGEVLPAAQKPTTRIPPVTATHGRASKPQRRRQALLDCSVPRPNCSACSRPRFARIMRASAVPSGSR